MSGMITVQLIIIVKESTYATILTNKPYLFIILGVIIVDPHNSPIISYEFLPENNAVKFEIFCGFNTKQANTATITIPPKTLMPLLFLSFSTKSYYFKNLPTTKNGNIKNILYQAK